MGDGTPKNEWTFMYIHDVTDFGRGWAFTAIARLHRRVWILLPTLIYTEHFLTLSFLVFDVSLGLERLPDDTLEKFRALAEKMARETQK
jgi:hypothetical protein